MGEEAKAFHPPSEHARRTFLSYLRGKPTISDINELDYQTIKIVRPKLGDLIVYMIEIYVVGRADIAEIVYERFPAGGPDAIVTLGVMNSYTGAAEALCHEHKAGLFTFNEFMGAVYYAGKKFRDYTPPEK